MLTRLVNALRAQRVFVRRRKSDDLRALGILLVYLGLSTRQAEEVLRGFGGASYEAIRQWYHRAKHILIQPP